MYIMYSLSPELLIVISTILLRIVDGQFFFPRRPIVATIQPFGPPRIPTPSTATRRPRPTPPSVLVPEPSTCRDALSTCVTQALQGGCVTNPSIMLRYCKLSCNPVCSRGNINNQQRSIPQQPQQPFFFVTTPSPALLTTPAPAPAPRLLATTTANQVRINRRRVPPACTDVDHNCKAWAEFNGCGEQGSWMRTFCKKSCNVACDTTTTTTTARSVLFTTRARQPLFTFPPVKPSEFIERGVRRLKEPEPGNCPIGCVPDESPRRRPVPPDGELTVNTLPCHVVSATVPCCNDEYVECSRLALTGMCQDEGRKSWMQLYCQWSCGACLAKSTLTQRQQIVINEICTETDCKSQPAGVMRVREHILRSLQQIGYSQFEARHSLHLTDEANKALLRRDGVDENIEPYRDGTYAGVLLTTEQAKAIMEYTQGRYEPSINRIPNFRTTAGTAAGVGEPVGGDVFGRRRQRQRSHRQRRQAASLPQPHKYKMLRIWDEMPVRYVLSPDFSMAHKVTIRQALLLVMSAVNSGGSRCIEFVEISANASTDVTHFITFLKDNTSLGEAQTPRAYRGRCGASHYGLVKRNAVFLNFECGDLGYGEMLGVVQQQVLRTLGVSNQHQRRDRHERLRLVHHRMDMQAYSSYAQNPLMESSYALPYDYDSIMHPTSKMARWMSAIEGCRRTFLAVRPKGLEMVIDLSDTERLDEQTQDVLSLGDVHAMQRLYCVSKNCRESERIECGYWMSDDALLCEHNQRIRQLCPRLCGDLQRGCHV